LRNPSGRSSFRSLDPPSAAIATLSEAALWVYQGLCEVDTERRNALSMAAARPSPKGRAAADRSSSSADGIEFSRFAHKDLKNYPNSTGNLAGQRATPWAQAIPEDARTGHGFNTLRRACRDWGSARVGDPLRDCSLRGLAWAAFRALGGSDVAEKIGIAAAWSRSASRTTPMAAFGMAREPDEPGKLDRALEISNGLPALRQRRMLSVFGAATWPPRRKSRPPDLIDFSMTPNRRLSAVRCQETEFRWC
jgi:hypothetical protein